MSIKDALLAVISAEEGGIKGRTLLQKKMSFVSVLVGEDFGFSPHYYGPFSSEVADQVGALREAALVAEHPVIYAALIGPFGELRRYDYSLTEPGEQVVQKRYDAVQRYTDAIAQINAHGIADNPNLLSTAAKVHFIVDEHGRATGRDIQRRAQELGWNISDTEIGQVVDYLERLGRVSTDR